MKAFLNFYVLFLFAKKIIMVSIKKLSVSLLCLMTTQSALLFGMEDCESNKNNDCMKIINIYGSTGQINKPKNQGSQKKSIIEGNLSIIPNFITYCLWYKQFVETTPQLKDNDPFINIIVSKPKYDNCPKYDNWRCDFHKSINGVFPSHLPVRCLYQKKTGDTLQFLINNDQPVKLTCNQVKYCNDGISFEERFNSLIATFDNKPSHSLTPDDLRLFVKKGILKKQEDGSYVHGKKGFRLLSKLITLQQ